MSADPGYDLPAKKPASPTKPTMQEIKFTIGRFPTLFENVYLKRFLDHDKILEEKTLSILATIEKIQENCQHKETTG